VQLPEPTDVKKRIKQSWLQNHSYIGKERIKRVINELLAERRAKPI
jgi:hypothetical protein